MFAFAACGRERSDGSQSFAGAPVIFISIDTLRADHLPAYGYTGVATPAIDAFRRDAILYQNAYSHVPMTLPSHVSLLTGLIPPQHEVRNNLGFPYDPRKHPPVSTMLKPAGYASGAAVSAYVLRGATGLAGGFDFYDDAVNTRNNVSVGELARAGTSTESIAEQWIGPRSQSKFFFLLHLFEPHTPYDPPEPYRSKYASAYDGEIATADAVVGTFVDFLKKSGIYDRALIVLLSDHGEGLGDHGEQEHGIFLYREALHVPLMVKLPKSLRGGELMSSPVQLIDVVPTVLEVAGVTRPKDLQGASLLHSKTGSEAQAIYSESLFARIHFGWSELRSLIDHDHQYIEAPKPELYDLAHDPAERNNLVATDRRRYSQMRDAMVPLRSVAAASNVDPEDAAKLAALGYIGTVRTSTGAGPLPDPKDMIGALEVMRAAVQRENAHDWAGAKAIYEQLLRDNPAFTDAWMKLAIADEQLGDLRGAVEAYRKAIAASPELAPGIAVSIGSLQLSLGDTRDAAAHANLAMSRSPGAARLLLARIAMKERNFPAAEREAQLAMAEKVRSSDAAVVLAQVLTAEGKVEEALALLNGVKGQTEGAGLGPVENLESARADLLARLGKNGEAEAGFRRELAAFPANRDAYSKLTLLYVSEGRLADARKTVEEMVRTNPGRQSMIVAAGIFEAVELPADAARWRAAASRPAR